jgi:hypothetical protein
MIIEIGENVDRLTIYLRKLAHFKFKGFFPPIYKYTHFCTRNLRVPISSASKGTSEVILTATEVMKLNF